MAEILHDEIIDITPQEILTGPHIMDIVSSGMYNEPMMVLREFIQNSTDSIDQAILNRSLQPDTAAINVYIDGKNRTIKIFDNGLGVQNSKVKRTLCSIAASEKVQGKGRGFRGIGRLGALGYCDELVFRTKGPEDRRIANVTWDALRLKELMLTGSGQDVASILSSCIKIEFETSAIESNSFFEVVLKGVKRFHNDDLMHIPSLKNYLSLNAPVPYHPAFSFKNEVESHISDVNAYKTYEITVNGKQIFKPYRTEYKISSKRSDQIREIKEYIFYDKKREIELARGWYAVTNFESSIPKTVHMRGISIRQGNILVGGDSFLADYFAEKRFATWCIGEIHISNMVKVNARRDGFEHTEELEAITEQFGLLGGHLSKIIRESSAKRSKDLVRAHTQEKLTMIRKYPIAINSKHKERMTEILNNAEPGNSWELVNRIDLLSEYMEMKNLKTTDPKEIIQRVVSIFDEEQNNPLRTAEFISKLANDLFMDS